MEVENPLLKRAYALAGDRDEIREVYADWAETYDKDTLDGMGYVAPRIAARILAENVDDDARLLDAGCGTGLVGVELDACTDAEIDGFDLSSDMLEVARAKGVYNRLSEVDMTRRLRIPDSAYDGVICVGVFTSGHVKPDALGELARVAKPGAPLVVTVHEKVWDKDAYPRALKGLEDEGQLRVQEITEAAYHQKEGFRCQLCVLEAA